MPIYPRTNEELKEMGRKTKKRKSLKFSYQDIADAADCSIHVIYRAVKQGKLNTSSLKSVSYFITKHTLKTYWGD